jgi:purine-binding chemotaxis protein CheW
VSASPSASADRALAGQPHAVVLCQAGAVVCALPLEHVLETLRPLPVDALSGTAPFIDGVSIIRGAPVPVIDLARLLGSDSAEPRTRLVIVKVGARRAALAVARVIGVRSLESAAVADLPPLLSGANSEIVAAVGSLDARLLLVLETSRMLPDFGWASLERADA